MKSIGFIDLYISEWHANKYPELIENANLQLGTDFAVKYVWAEKDISPVDSISTSEWCEKYGATQCDTLEELCEKSDILLLLAPSNPEVHLRYAEVALKYGKRIYIDKTFAPDYLTAKEIFAIAENNKTPFFSTSALRFAAELDEIDDVKNIMITGGGSNFEEYLIHQIEMAVKILKSPARKVMVTKVGTQRICHFITENETEGVIIYSPVLNFSVLAEKNNGEIVKKNIKSDFFAELLLNIVKFYENGDIPFDTNETLEVMRLRTAILAANTKKEQWFTVKELL